jgi:hypothetical protein
MSDALDRKRRRSAGAVVRDNQLNVSHPTRWQLCAHYEAPPVRPKDIGAAGGGAGALRLGWTARELTAPGFGDGQWTVNAERVAD